MKKALLLACLLGIPCALVAQTGRSSWAGLSGLRVGQKIQIVEFANKKQSGTFVSLSDSALWFNNATGSRSVQKQDVQSVKLMENAHRLRNTLIGLGVGAGAGAAIVLGTCESGGSSNWFHGYKGTCAGIGAGVGGILGTAVGVLVPSHQTIYSVNPR